MTIKSIHGKFIIDVQLFTKKGNSTNFSYFELSRQFQDDYVSNGLKEYSAYYSNRMSYEEVAKLIERNTGEKLLSDQKIRQIVINKAAQHSKEIAEEIDSIMKEKDYALPKIDYDVDIYSLDNKEILLFDDGIQVKGQKENREKKSCLADSSKEANETKKKIKINTDVMCLERLEGGFEYIIAAIDKNGKELTPLQDIVKAKIYKDYANVREPLNIVAVTDGATAIRRRLLSIFGKEIVVILDWYHLTKKVKELMSMIARNKEEKQKHIEVLLHNLWQGITENALDYLKKEVTAKNEAKLSELIKYLEKHEKEIIDYGRRQKAGKTIGSGRMEKAVDRVIGFRQKKKGMSWSRIGCKSLGILKVVELNNKWDELWFDIAA